MNTEQLKKELRTPDIRISSYENETTFASQTDAYAEDCVKLRDENGHYKVLEVHRADERLIADSDSLEEAFITALVRIKGMCGSSSLSFAGKMKKYAGSGKVDTALEQLEKHYGSKLFVCDDEKAPYLSLIRRDNDADLMYNGRYILKNAQYDQALFALSAHCEELKAINEFIEKKIAPLDIKLDFDKLREICIIG